VSSERAPQDLNFAATCRQVRELDRIAIEEYGIPGIVLMENAARACALAAEDMLGGAQGRRVAVLCGKGNNGGDGFAVARHLTNWGSQVRILLLASAGDILAGPGETATNLRVALKMGIPLDELRDAEGVAGAVAGCADADLIVDALLGTGISGQVREPYLGAIRALNALGVPVLAVDVPSGLDCDTGRPLGEAVRADRTVTFVFRKVGFGRPGAAQYTGQVQVAEIGIPRPAIERKLAEWRSEAATR